MPTLSIRIDHDYLLALLATDPRARDAISFQARRHGDCGHGEAERYANNPALCRVCSRESSAANYALKKVLAAHDRAA